MMGQSGQFHAFEFRAAMLRHVIAGDHVERRGLAAAVGTDQPMDFGLADGQVETVDRAHATEAQRHALERQRVRVALLSEQPPE